VPIYKDQGPSKHSDGGKIPDRVPETFSSIGGVGTSIDLFEVHLTALKVPRKERNGRIIFGIQLQRPMKWSFQGMI
jgi:hypothetical protein